MLMSDASWKVEVIAGVARRRRFATELKLAVVAETMQPGMSVSYVARRHGLSPSVGFRWRQCLSEGGKEAVGADEGVVAASAVRRLQQRVRELERLLGRKTMEVEILKEARSTSRGQKNRSCCRTRYRREVPGEDRQHNARRGALEHHRARQREAAPARAAGACVPCRAGRRHPRPCRRAPDLRIPSDRRAIKARAAIRRFGPGQRQARLSADE